MTDAAPNPKFVVDASGKKSGVLLKIRDYEQLIEAWEEVADAKDFAAARGSAKAFVSPNELRGKVLGK